MKRLQLCMHYLTEAPNQEIDPYEFKPGLANNPACAVDHAPKITIDSSLPSALLGRNQLPVLQGTCGRGSSFLLS
jgi:hypothetical protein